MEMWKHIFSADVSIFVLSLVFDLYEICHVLINIMAVWMQICQAHEVFLDVCFWKYIPCIMGWKITKQGDWKNNCFCCRYRPSIWNSLLAIRPIPATIADLEGSVFSQMVHGELHHILWIIITPLCAAQTIILQKNLLRRAPTKCNFFKLKAFS